MLARARNRPGGEAVGWIEGAAEQIEPASADLVIMSGNVAMHIIGDLTRVGLRIVATHRSWSREPFTGGPDQPLMIFVAERS